MQKLTITVREAYYIMRAAGIKCNEKMISAGIASGAYPFGRVVQVGETGRRTLEIFRVDLEDWIESKSPKSTITYTAQPQPLQLMRKSM